MTRTNPSTRDFFVLSFAVFVAMGSLGLTDPIIAVYGSKLTTSLFIIGFVVSCYFIIRLAIELPFGLLSDLIGRRAPTAFGIGLSIISSAICGLADNVHTLIAGHILMGIANGAFFCTALAAMSDLFPPEKRGRMIGLYQAIQYLGSIAGSFLCSYIVLNWGYPTIFYTIAATSTPPLVILLVSRSLERKGGSREKTITTVKESLGMWRALATVTVLMASFMALVMVFRD